MTDTETNPQNGNKAGGESSPVGAKSPLADIERAIQSNRGTLEELERLAKLKRAKEIEEQIRKGALPSISFLPLPEDDNTIAKVPTFFARNPIFKPVKDREAQDTDWNEGEQIVTPWGRVTRFGPGLTVFDEGTLIGLFRTCWRQQQSGPRLAHRGLEVVKDAGELEALDRKHLDNLIESVTTVVGAASYYQINSSLGRDTGGKSLLKTKESIERLAKQIFKVYKKDSDKFSIVHLFYLAGDECSDGNVDMKSGVSVLFPPGMVQMMSPYTLINLRIWHELNGVGKSVYKFLSSHLTGGRKTYEIGLDKLIVYVGYKGSIDDFRRAMLEMGQRLVKLGWAEGVEVLGTGRKVPRKLSVNLVK